MAIVKAFRGQTFASAPLQNPPITGGMRDSWSKALDIASRDNAPSQAEYAQIPVLLRRLRHLLRVYYDAKMTRRRPDEFKYCDEPDVEDVGLRLHEVGLFFQLRPTRFRVLLGTPAADGQGSLENFLLDEPLDLGAARLAAQELVDRAAADPEADDADRERAMGSEDNAGGDLAAYQMSFLVGDLLVACALHAPPTEQRTAERALERLVDLSTKNVNRLALGDGLTDAMRPVYTDKRLLVRFAHLGGLSALVGDWAESELKDGLCHQAVLKLPNKAWDNQTPASLRGVMEQLLRKTEHSDLGEGVIKTPPFMNILFQIYVRYGVAPFSEAARVSDTALLAYFLHRRLTKSKHPERYRARGAFEDLIDKYMHVPRATRRRHGWMILGVSGRWDCLTYYGCASPSCPELAELLRIRERRVRGQRDAAIEERLYDWGAKSKMCARCRFVSYCSATCQRADWSQHKAKCASEAATGNNEDME